MTSSRHPAETISGLSHHSTRELGGKTVGQLLKEMVPNLYRALQSSGDWRTPRCRLLRFEEYKAAASALMRSTASISRIFEVRNLT